MDHLLSKEEPQQHTNQVPLESRTGPLLLLAAFAIMLFKFAPHYLPLTITAFLGYATIRLFAKTGLILSCIALASVWIFHLRNSPEYFWAVTLSLSILCAWLLIYLGDQDKKSAAKKTENLIKALEDQIQDLKKSLRQEKDLSRLADQKHIKTAELEKRLSEEILAREQKTVEMQGLLEERQTQTAELERLLSEEILAHEQKNIEVQGLLEQLEQLKNLPASMEAEEIRYSHALLREQFEEKSQILDETRKELFHVENTHLALRKAWEEKEWEPSEEYPAFASSLKKAEEEALQLKEHADLLEGLVSTLLLPKKRSSPRKTTKKAPKKKAAPELF
jgi:hypothetical protein